MSCQTHVLIQGEVNRFTYLENAVLIQGEVNKLSYQTFVLMQGRGRGGAEGGRLFNKKIL